MLSGGWSRRKCVFVCPAANVEQTSHRFVSRFFLNLRSITSHEVLTEALTQVPPSAIAWRRPFTEFKMDKGIFSSGPTPSEPDAQHAEEAMELQAHGH